MEWGIREAARRAWEASAIESFRQEQMGWKQKEPEWASLNKPDLSSGQAASRYRSSIAHSIVWNDYLFTPHFDLILEWGYFLKKEVQFDYYQSSQPNCQSNY